jgi:hypothetical protein
MCAFDRLKIRPLTRITSTLWNSVIDALNELYGWLTDGTKDINVDEVYGRKAHFRERIDCEGRPVILDGDPISIYQFYDVAKSQITEAIDRSSLLSKAVSDLGQIYGKLPSSTDITSSINNARVTSNTDLIAQYTGASRSLLEQIYGKLPSKEDVTSAIDSAKVTSSTDLIAQYTGSSKALLEQIYGKLPSKEDITSAIDSALVTGYSLDIREYTRRTAETIETYAPKLTTIEEYTRETRDVLVKIRIDEYGNVGVKIAEPLDEYGRVVISTPSELLDEFKPVSASGSISAVDNTAGFSLVLSKGGRPNVNVYYSLGGAGTVYLKVSVDGVAWRTLKTYTLTGAGEGVDIVQGVAYPYVRLETLTTGIDVAFEIVASR